tara:strand:+ start:829 stop:975 length:147 start_codon:yes stop_codon:yes gene_type:complete
MIKKIIYISILLVFILNNSAISSDLSLAKDAYNKNDLKQHIIFGAFSK